MGSEESTLGDLIDATGGSIQTGPFGTKLKASEYTETGVPVISVGEVGFGRIRLHEKTPKVDITIWERMPEYLLKTDDIVFGRKGAVERSAHIQPNEDGYFLGSDGIRVRLNPDESDPRFIAYQFQSELHKVWMIQHAAGTTMPSLNEGIIRRIPITLPPLPEQKAIAHILGSLDDKIELNRRMNATLEGMAQALFKSWFVDFDPVIDNALAAGNPIPDELAPRAEVRRQALKIHSSQLTPHHSLFPAAFQFTEELGWIPEGWEVGDIENTTSAIIDHRGKTPKKLGHDWAESGFPAVSAKNIKDGKLVRKDTIKYTDTALYERWMAEELQKGDVLMTSEAPLGEKLYLAKQVKWVLSQRLFALRANDQISGVYLYHWLNTDIAKADIDGRASGTTVQGIRQSELRKVKVLTPDENSIGAFSDACDALMEKRSINEENTEQLTKLRDTLLPKLISGDLRIADAKKFTMEAFV